MEAFGIDNHNMAEDRVVQLRSPERGGKLLGSEYRAEILRISIDIVTTSPFKIDVPASSKSVGFCA